jgi:hypothetical protein
MLYIAGLRLPMLGGELVTGNVYFVDGNATGASDSNDGLRPDRGHALATIDGAVGKCTANNGDIIVVAANHTETYTAAGSLTLDIAGITIIGIGGYSSKPTITLGAAAADMDVTAADVTIKNIMVKPNFADVLVGFNVSAKGFTLIDCDFRDTAANMNFTTYLNLPGAANVADGLTCIGCRAISADTGANTRFIYTVDDIDGLTLHHNFISLGVKNDVSMIEAATGKDFTNVDIKYNSLSRLNASEATAAPIMYSDTTANSGIIAWNACGSADADAAKIWDVTGARLVENYAARAADANGLIIPAGA